jgi:hypothetical protein
MAQIYGSALRKLSANLTKRRDFCHFASLPLDVAALQSVALAYYSCQFLTSL